LTALPIEIIEPHYKVSPAYSRAEPSTLLVDSRRDDD